MARQTVIADDLRWPLEELAKAWSELDGKPLGTPLAKPLRKPLAKVDLSASTNVVFGADFDPLVEADDDAGLVYLRRSLVRRDGTPRESNKPTNPNVLQGWGKTWSEVPDCGLKDRVLLDIWAMSEALGPRFLAACKKGFPPAPTVADDDAGKPLGTPLAKPLAKPSLKPLPKAFRQKQKQKQKQKDLTPPLPPSPSEGGAATSTAPQRLPFTVAALLAELERASGGRVPATPFDRRLAPAVTAVIRELAAAGLGLEAVTLAGEWLAAGGMAYRDDLSPNWVATRGSILSVIGLAKAWHESGRPDLGPRRARAPGSGFAEAARGEEFDRAGNEDIPF